MAVKIRLRRMGAKKKPYYRIVVADARSPRDGRFIETIGHYDPKSDPLVYTLDQDKAKAWLAKGAEPTEAVARVLYKFGLVERPWKEDAPTGATGSETAVKEGGRTRRSAAAPAAATSEPTGGEEPAKE